VYCAVLDVSKDRAQSVLWGKLTVRDHLESLGVDGRIILKYILKNCDRGMGWIDLVEGQVGGFCECDNEPSVFTQCVEFLDQQRNC
jgi:hypothetical protein